MKRWITHATIALYLGVLVFGLCCHAVGFYAHSHPLMYFCVWDMYCGWSAFESRYHVLGQAYSGQYYELVPAPWGEFRPFGEPGRQNYDNQARFLTRMALTTLRHTEHEPIHQIVVIEEAWSKKNNLPDELWALRHQEPKDPYSYFHLRVVAGEDGRVLKRFPEWSTMLSNHALTSNPRLMSDVSKGHSFFALDRPQPANSGIVPTSYSTYGP
jgi:hypothetical protein